MCHLERLTAFSDAVEVADATAPKNTDEFILVAIMTTLCATNRNDFIVYYTKRNALEKWESMDLMRSFYCVPEKVVENASELHKMRAVMFDQYQWIYDDIRCIPRDTKNPGNKSDTYKTKAYKKSFTYWTIQKGTRKLPYISDKDAMLPAELTRIEKARLKKEKENAQLEEKLKANADVVKSKVLKAQQDNEKKGKHL